LQKLGSLKICLAPAQTLMLTPAPATT